MSLRGPSASQDHPLLCRRMGSSWPGGKPGDPLGPAETTDLESPRGAGAISPLDSKVSRAFQ